ncbi:MAG: hypothetical protein JWP54_242 [Cryobacterium sp.]|jgi:hypothetical protein|nr:hypothetical protein [Cryobacterium sp.]
MVPPSLTAPRSAAGRKPGTWGAIALSFAAATFTSSGRTTPSTKPTVKSSPFGSLSTPANCAPEASTGYDEASRSHRRTSAMASALRVASTESADGEVGVLAPGAAERRVMATFRGGGRRPRRSLRAYPLVFGERSVKKSDRFLPLSISCAD